MPILPVAETPTPQSPVPESGFNRVLVVDDEKNMRRLLEDLLTEDGWEVLSAGSAEEGLARIAEAPFQAIVLDLALPGMNGLEMLQNLRDRNIEPSVVIITAFATIDVAVRAMKAGAVDFLVKPFDNARLKAAMRKIRETHDLLSNTRLTVAGEAQGLLGAGNQALDFVTADARMNDVVRVVRRVASTSASVLITGEQGTGKELVAQAIHYNGDRRDRPFVSVNCAALPETLLDAELFGSERGSFGGEFAVQKGRVEIAEGGTLFLDDIGELPLSLQTKVLRLLKEGRYTRAGSDKAVEANVRVICATDQDLAEAVRARAFMADLLYALGVITITIPPLRERREDIRHLITLFFARFAKRHRLPLPTIPFETMQALMEYDWPGNIRELQNCVEKAVVLQDPRALMPAREGGAPTMSLKLPVSAAGQAVSPDEALLDLGRNNSVRQLHDVAADAQRAAVIRALRICDNNKSEAAKRLGVSYKTLFNKIHELGIQISTTIE